MPYSALLFDLDDTLLGNDMDHFLPQYFPRLANFARQVFPEMRFDFVQEMMRATQQTIQAPDGERTNARRFWEAFGASTGIDWEDLEAEKVFDRFYQTEFEALRAVTESRPTAVPLIERAFNAGLKVVIATNPLFPYSAIAARLRWAGLPPETYAFDLITHYGNMHATKPQTAYYTEVLECIETPAEEALMVGNDWDNDIRPATAVGIDTYWIAARDVPSPAPLALVGQGSLEECYQFLIAEKII